MAGRRHGLKLSPDGGVEGVNRDERAVHQRVFVDAAGQIYRGGRRLKETSGCYGHIIQSLKRVGFLLRQTSREQISTCFVCCCCFFKIWHL